MPSQSRAGARILVLAIVAAAVFLLTFRMRMALAHFFVFQARDIERARQVAHGIPVFFGPEATGGGNLPGGFYYWLLAVPLAAGLGWIAELNLDILLFGLGALYLVWSLSAVASLDAALVGGLLYASSFGLGYLVSQNNNASFAPLFAVIAAVELIRAFGGDGKHRRRWLTSCFFLGLAVQVHYSTSALLFAAVVLQFSPRSWGLRRLEAGELAAGAAVFAATLLPSVIGIRLQAAGLLPGSAGHPSGQGSILGAVPSLLHQIALESGATPFGTLVILLALLPAPLLLFRLARGGENEKLVRAAAVVTAVSFVPAAYVFSRWIGFRYVTAFEVSGAFLAALLHERGARRPAYGAGAAALFALIAAFVLLHGGPQSVLTPAAIVVAASLAVAALSGTGPAVACLLVLGASFLRTPLMTRVGIESGAIPAVEIPAVGAVEAFAEHVRVTTGWSYEEARKRIFFAGTHEEQSIETIYKAVAAKIPSEPEQAPKGFVTSPFGTPDGFIVGMGPSIEREGFRTWLLRQNPLQPDLRRGLDSGAVRLGVPRNFGKLWSVPYFVDDARRFPRHFQNTGYPYETGPGEALLAAREPGAHFLDDGNFLFVWQDCPDPGCRAGMHVGVRTDGKTARADVLVLGKGLSQPSEWTYPDATLAWTKPYVEVRCGKGEPVRAELAASLGTDPSLAYLARGMASSYSVFLSPYERSVELPCKGKLAEISAGREKALVITPLGNREADPRPLSFRPR